MLAVLLGLYKQIILLISYISNSSSFPKPLSTEDEQKCLELYRNGDNAAKDKLIEHNLRLVAHIAKKYAGSVRDNEDLISIGTIGLMKGITTFHPDKGTRLATYAARCISNAITSIRQYGATSMGYLGQKRTRTATSVSAM